MHATAIVVALGLAATAHQAPSPRSAEAQEVRVCGEVKTQRTTAPPACDTTMRVVSAGEDFDVLIPASVVRQLALAPQRMRGAQACFTGRVSRDVGAARLSVSSSSAIEVLASSADSNFGADAAIPCSGNVTMPQVVKEQRPHYSSDAMRARVQGRVELQAIVDVDGSVSQARVVSPLHPDLDEEALRAVKAWHFVPGTVNGKPAPVLVEIEMSFAVSSRR